jgi:hypothetical protein
MRFMMLVKHAESSMQPPKEFLEAMNRLNEEATKSGAFHGGGALKSTATAARVRLSGGEIRAIDGPFTETKEIVGGFGILEFPSREEAVKSAVEFMGLHKKYWPGWEGETEVRQICGPEDFAPHK